MPRADHHVGILDFAIRPDHEPPPLKQAFVLFGRISSTLCFSTFIVLIFHLHLYVRWTFLMSFSAYSMIHHFVMWMDVMVSNAFGRNVKNLRKAGYTDWTIVACMEHSFLLSSLLGHVIVNYAVSDPRAFTLPYFVEQFGVELMAKVLLNLSLAELLFMTCHSLMHTNPHLMKLHIIHHCVTFSSWNTNFLFHPADLVLEFAAPAASVLAMHYLVWRDSLTLLVTYIVLQLWYAFDHDELLGLYHVQHHRTCDSLYAIYTNMTGTPNKNQLKHYMRRLELSWPQAEGNGHSYKQK